MSTLTLPRSTNPLLELLKDFNSEFFNINHFIDWDKEVPSLKSSLLYDKTGFPRANIRNVSTTDEDRLEIVLALPGWNKENSELDITIENSILKITGKVKDTTPETIKNAGKAYGKEYERNISLKNSFVWQHSVAEDTEFESATLKDGLLTLIVKLPQPDKPKPKRITVE